MAREYEPVVGQWYDDIDENENFRVLSVDEDAELIEVEYLDGDIEEIDLETWHELDLDKIEEPEGWAASHVDEDAKKAAKGTEKKEDDEELDDTWDEDEDEDEEDDDDDDDDDDDEDEDEDWEEEGEE